MSFRLHPAGPADRQPIAVFLLILLLCLEADSRCGPDMWDCDNGECIEADAFCDGQAQCADKSDETAEHCLRNGTCASYAFRCSYGSCVAGTFRCNGRVDCADGSDELPLLCASKAERSRLLAELQGNCSLRAPDDEDTFYQCKSGECISDELRCDGRLDCADGSDETLALCSTAACPGFAFRCAYGGCIPGRAVCDGRKDCADGSDEGSALCNKPRPTRPKPTPDVEEDDGDSGDGGNGSCRLPKRPSLIARDQQGVALRAGSAVAANTRVSYACERGFTLEGALRNFCAGSGWDAPVPQCLKFCSLRLGYSRTPTCLYQGSQVDCDRVRAGGTAHVYCAVGFEKLPFGLGDVMTCRADGSWDVPPLQCQQECGQVAANVVNFSIGGSATNITKAPWHVGIYDFLDGASFRHICGGSIISPTLVVSAAHCFWDEANEKLYPVRLYRVGAGKYYRELEAPQEPLTPQIRNISHIYVEGYRGKSDRYRNDIALLKLDAPLQYSFSIRPVCLEFQQRGNQQVATNDIGSFAGWGFGADRRPAALLQTVKMRTLSFTDCERLLEGRKTDYRLPDDKFCLTDDWGRSACVGDSGGGFVIQKSVNLGQRVQIYYQLVGVISHAPVSDQHCARDGVVALTNVQYFEALIKGHRIAEYSQEF